MLLGSKILIAASSIVAWGENLACGSSTSASVENLACGLLYESLGPESLANSTALARSSSTVLASSSTVLANSSCVTISLWARLVLAEFVLNSGRREKVSSPGVALDPSPSNVVVRTIRGRTRGMRGRFQPRGLGLLIIIGSSRVPGKHLLFCLDVASCCFVLMCLCVCAAPKRGPRDRLRAAQERRPARRLSRCDS